MEIQEISPATSSYIFGVNPASNTVTAEIKPEGPAPIMAIYYSSDFFQTLKIDSELNQFIFSTNKYKTWYRFCNGALLTSKFSIKSKGQFYWIMLRFVHEKPEERTRADEWF